MPSGAVASMLENDATKNTIFFDDFTGGPFVVSCVSHKSIELERNPKVPTGGTVFVSELSKLCKIRRAKRLPEIP
jgi:hypothetical protein